ncbi:hypothetical protein AX16_003332 [Volvariella volvacea WC 439]|nr:hypothetical protein AX16_003332 [Volvariella volvacea WC 439]
MVEIPPGFIYIGQNLPRILTPPACVFVLDLLVKNCLGCALSEWQCHWAYALSFPVALFVKVQWRDYVDRRTARALGAEPIPRIPDRTPGGIALLMASVKNGKTGYPGDGLDDYINSLGHTFILRLLFSNWILTSEPAYTKAILSTQFDEFEKGAEMQSVFHSLLGAGILAVDGEVWRLHRTLARPFFTKDKIQHFDIFDRHAEDALHQIRTRLREGYPVDFQDVISRFTLDSATEYLLGHDVKSLSAGLPYPHYSHLYQTPQGLASSHPANKFAQALFAAQVHTAARARYGEKWPLFEFWKDKVKGPMKIVHEFIEPILYDAIAAKKQMQIRGVSENKESDTLLEQLVSSTDDFTFLREAIVSFLLAGRDSTASAVTFAVYMLAEHPKVLRRLREEIMSEVGPTRRPNYEDFRSMKYLRVVINETLRLYPPVPFNSRFPVEPTTWAPLTPNGKRFYVPTQAKTIYSAWMMHRRKDLWGPDALMFDPDRFLDHRLDEYFTPNPNIFLPFSTGPRTCLGQPFAYNEISFFLVRLLQSFEKIEVDVDAQPEALRPPKSWSEGERTKEVEKVWIRTHLSSYSVGGLWVRMQEASGND